MDQVLAGYLEEGIAAAARNGADAVLIEQPALARMEEVYA